MPEQQPTEQSPPPARGTRTRMGARKVTLSLRRASKAELQRLRELNDAETTIEERPRRRADCQSGGSNAERPCPWASCRYHLAVDVQASGALTINFPDREIDELLDTCALDVAERGGLTREDVAARMNLTRERVRQLEELSIWTLPDEQIRQLQEARQP